MESSEKDLLVKDLCARLPYGVKVQFKMPEFAGNTFTNEIGEVQSVARFGGISVSSDGVDHFVGAGDYKPYLRPLSSMTSAEKSKLELLKFRYDYDCLGIINEDVNELDDYRQHPYTMVDEIRCSEVMDFLRSHHFDHLDFIQKGLAIEAPEGMYKIH